MDYTRTPHRKLAYGGTPQTIQAMEAAAAAASRSLPLRLAIEDVVRYIAPRDKLSQMAAIYNWFSAHYSFVSDPVDVEQVKSPQRVLKEIVQTGIALGDCDDASTLLRGCLGTLGIRSEFARTGFQPPPVEGTDAAFSHVLAVGVDQYNRRVVLDPVAGVRTGGMINRSYAPRLGLGADEVNPMVTVEKLEAAMQAAMTGDRQAVLALNLLVRQARRELASGLWDVLPGSRWTEAVGVVSEAERTLAAIARGADLGLAGRFIARRRRARARRVARRAGATLVTGPREAQEAARTAATGVRQQQAAVGRGEVAPQAQQRIEQEVQQEEQAEVAAEGAAPVNKYKTPLIIGAVVIGLVTAGLVAFGGKKKPATAAGVK